MTENCSPACERWGMNIPPERSTSIPPGELADTCVETEPHVEPPRTSALATHRAPDAQWTAVPRCEGKASLEWRVRSRGGRVRVAGAFAWRARSRGGCVRVAGAFAWRARSRDGRVRVTGAFAWRARSSGGRVRVAGAFAWRARSSASCSRPRRVRAQAVPAPGSFERRLFPPQASVRAQAVPAPGSFERKLFPLQARSSASCSRPRLVRAHAVPAPGAFERFL